MVKIGLIIALIVTLIVVFVFVPLHKFSTQPMPSPTPAPTLAPSSLKLTSSAFQSGQPIPTQYTCDGQNLNPPLTIDGVPPQTQSLVLIMDDPDAPSGTWTHWVIYNIDPKAMTLPANGQFATNSAGQKNYSGPCPPSGQHRYFFKLFALNTLLHVSNPNRAAVEQAMQSHIVGTAELMGVYKRQK